MIDDRRADRARDFLARAGWDDAARAALAGDASNRRYERLRHPRLGPAVLMDAPPATGEDVRPFAAVTGWLRQRGLSAPEILAADVDHGFLLLEDLGDDLYARVAARAPALEPELYAHAVDLLAGLAAAPPPAEGAGSAPYDAAVLRREAMLAVDWWLAGLSAAPVPAGLGAEFAVLIDSVCAEAARSRSVLTLRDYHAENLIWLPERAGAARVGLLDYQDALFGHPAYDLASLLEDARRDVPEDLAEAMIERYLGAVATPDRSGFRAAYAALGAQRNLKIIGIFARLWLRDGKDRYLAHIPRVWDYLRRDLAHPALARLRDWVERRLPAPTPERLAMLRARTRPIERASAAGIDTAMILSAGLGARMRPLTDHTPKPLLTAGGRTLLEHAMTRAAELGARRCVVNIHYLGEQIRAFLAARAPGPETLISDESAELLDTGGGVKKALPLIGRETFLVVNSDNLWLGPRALGPLLEHWRPEAMDALLLLTPIEAARGYGRAGDFSLDAAGRLIRRGDRPRAPLVYTGAQIIAARLFDGMADGAFSFNRVWDAAIAAGRAHGCVGHGGWVDVGTPAGLAAAEAALALETGS